MIEKQFARRAIASAAILFVSGLSCLSLLVSSASAQPPYHQSYWALADL
ncbi:hypothetical protein [Breoghania sp.]|nr:hypothetical protein [Breoghania sp.]MDJ0929908.1 hypothetical protein [Breoghania sp.]